MITIDGQPIFTAVEMRAAEERAITAGSSVEELMERAGAGVAEAVRRLAAGAPVLVLCGPGNNGGYGYVAARILKANGLDVRVLSVGASKTEAAAKARTRWGDVVTPFDTAEVDWSTAGSTILVDAIYGTGLTREIDDGLANELDSWVAWSRLPIAVDLPSGVDTDSGSPRSRYLGVYALTLALGAVKPAHVLYPSAMTCGDVRLIDLGIDVASRDVRPSVIARPWLDTPRSASTKYSRGMVAVIGGTMPGAASLASEAAMRSGVGYVMHLTDDAPPSTPYAIVHRRWSRESLEDKRIGATLIGPGSVEIKKPL